jgi:hypothetical protein
MEVIRSSETLVLVRHTPQHIPEDGIFQSHRQENMKSCIADSSLLHNKSNLYYLQAQKYEH